MHAFHARVASRNALSVRGNRKPSRRTRRETRRYPAAILAEMTSCVVQLISGKTMSFDVASVSTVWQLKKMVKRSIDVPKRQQRLLNGARELTNHSPLNCSQRLTLVIVDTTCQVCDAETSAPRICGGCYGALYCCEACQRHDWQRHRDECVPPWISL